MIDGFLESALLGACPGLRDGWSAVRRTYPGKGAPDEKAFLTQVRLHVVGLLAAQRVAEFARFARVMERLLGEADPMLDDLLREGLLEPLAADLADAGIPHVQVEPYLGPRTAVALLHR